MTASTRTNKPVVVLTGSDGLIGTPLVRALHKDYDIVGLDNDRSTKNDELYDLIYCDLTKDQSVEDAFQQVRERHGDRIASFIHLAAYYDFSGEDSPLYEELTVKGTERVLLQLQDFEVEQFVFSSTLLVMQPSESGRPIDESSPLQAEWRYPESKLRTEELIERERGEIPVVILRIGGVYTEWGDAVPIARQVNRIYEKQLESYLFPGNPNHGQSMVHLDDLIDCFEQVVDKRADLDEKEVFLIGEESVMSYGELQDRVGEQIHGKEWPAIRIPKPIAKAGAKAKDLLPGQDQFIKPWMVDLADQDYRIDISKAKRKLDWRPTHKIEEVLPKITDNLLEHPDEWRRRNRILETVKA